MKTIFAIAICMLLALPAASAPRLKDKGYTPDGWIDILCNQPPEERPWLAMENCVKGMDRDTWLEVGREMSKRMKARFKRLGFEDWNWPSCFDVSDDDVERGHVAGTLWHYKWLEARKCDANPFMPPAYFWESGRVVRDE